MSNTACTDIDAAPASAQHAPPLPTPRSRTGSPHARRPRDAAAASARRTLLGHRAPRYEFPRMPALFGVLAVIASVLIFIVMVALPAVSNAPSRARHALLHQPARIAALSALQRDSLLAAACWPHTCALTERK